MDDIFPNGNLPLPADDFLFICALPLMAVLVFLVHELGHYVTARLYDVRVGDITIGLGREIWRRVDRRGTLWSVRIFPVCGFIHLVEPGEKQPGQRIEQREFSSCKLGERLVMVAAGPFANLFFSFMLFAFLFMAAGQPSTRPVITAVEIDSPADKAGFKPGDMIAKFEGRPVTRYDDIQPLIENARGKTLSFTIKRGEDSLETKAVPYHVEYVDNLGIFRSYERLGTMALHTPLKLSAIAFVDGVETGGDEDKTRALLAPRVGQAAILGIKSVDLKIHDFRINLDAKTNAGLLDPQNEGYGHVYPGPYKNNFFLPRKNGVAYAAAFKETARLTSGIFKMSWKMWPMDKTLVQPQAKVTADGARYEFSMFRIIYFGVIVSICLAVINLFPVPGLDGGYLILLLTEAVAGRERMALLTPYIQRLSMLLFLLALILINAGPHVVHFSQNILLRPLFALLG